MTQLKLKIKIDTTLSKTDYLKLVFPFGLHTKLTAAVNAENDFSHPQSLLLTWNILDDIDGSEVNTEDYPGQIFTDTVDSANYYLKFYDLEYLQQILDNTKSYILKFNIMDSNSLKLQKGGELLQIQAFTQSSLLENAIIYDQNQSFNYLYLESQPTDQMVLSTTFKDPSTQHSLKTEQEIFIDLEMKYPIENFQTIMRIVFLLSDNSYTFTNSCSSISKTTIPTIQALNANEFECSINQQTNEVTFLINISAFKKQTIFRFQLFVLSPSFVISNINIISRLLYEFSPKILTQSQISGVLSTNPIDVQNQKLFLGFGLQPDTELPFQLKFVRGNEADTYHPYNGVKIIFQLKENTPLDQELRINFFIKSEINAYLLKNSIAENLPKFNDKEVVCQEIDSSFPLKRKISCSGVGQLLSTQTYFLSFRIFLPYDVYEPDINLSYFGTISIETSKKIDINDNVFIIGRDPSLKQIYSDQLDSNIVNSDIQSYIDYLKSFDDVYLMALVQDFPDYSKEIYPNFYEKGSTKNDVFLPVVNLNFLNYLEQYNDIWIIQKNVRNPLVQPDQIKSKNTNLLVKLSIPKNSLSIPSVVSKDWQQTGKTLISSAADQNSLPTIDEGLKVNNSEQMLIFQTKIPFADITSFTNTASTDYSTSDFNNVGLLMIMNPLIQVPSTKLTQDWLIGSGGVVANNAAVQTQVTQANNSYSYFKLSIKNSDVILDNMAPDAATDKTWALRNVMLQNYSSIYADDRLMDFYITLIDGIDGPLNHQKSTSYVLINGFSLLTTITGLDPYISNFWQTSFSSTTDQKLTGLMATSFYKILLTDATLLDSTDEKLVLFFDLGQGFYQNKHFYKNNCASNSSMDQQSCKLFPIGKKYNVLDYSTLNYFEIQIQDPAQLSQILLPVFFENNSITNVNLYIGTQTPNPNNANKSYYYMKNIKKVTLTQTVATQELTSALDINSSTGNFEATCTDTTLCQIGKIKQNQAINMYLTSSSVTASAKAQFTLYSDQNFLTENTVLSSWPLATSGTDPDPCLKFDYKYVSSLKSNQKYGLACTWFSGSNANSNSVILSEFQIPINNAFLEGFGTLSDGDGQLDLLTPLNIQFTELQDVTTIGDITITPSMLNSVLELNFTTVLEFKENFKIQYITSGVFTSKSSISQCVLKYILPDQETEITSNSTCTPVFGTTDFKIVVSDVKEKIPVGSQITIIYYGISTFSMGADSTFDFYILDKNDNQIAGDATIKGNIIFQTGEEATKLILSDFYSQTRSKHAMTYIQFKFSLINKKLWPGEKFVFDLGQFAFENKYNIQDLQCFILNEDLTLSQDFQNIDLGQLNDLTVTVRKYTGNNNPVYYLKCNRLITPAGQFAQGIQGSILATDLSVIYLSEILSLPSFYTEKANIYENQITKNLGTPGSNLELEFILQTSLLTVNSKSRIIIIFPIYYSVQLSRDDSLSCYYKEIRLSCKVTYDRTLEIKYFPEDIPPQQEIPIQISGVTQPLYYQVGSYFIAFDDDYDNSQYIQYSYLTDQGILNDADITGTLQIIDFQISSSFLREDSVSYVITIDYPSSYSNLSYGNAIMINFPNNFSSVLQNYIPDCSIKRVGNDKEYSGICKVNGLKLVIYVKEEVVSGFQYVITLLNLRNPDIYTPIINKFIIETTDSDMSKVIYRSLESTTNYVLPPFIKNPDQDYLFFKDKDNNIINNLSLIKGVQSEKLYIGRESESPVFARSFILYSETEEIDTYPFKIYTNVGTNIQKYNIHSYQGIGEYALQLNKSGDGSYYSNLPILFLQYDDRNTETFQISQTELSIYSSDTELILTIPYTIDCLPPLENLNVYFFLETSQLDQGIEVNEIENNKPINYNKPFGFISLKISDPTKFSDISSFKVHYQISGSGQDSYTLDTVNDNNKITFNVSGPLADQEITPTITLQTATQSSQTINISCNANGVFYWQLYLTEVGTVCQQSQDDLINGAQRNYSQNDLHFQCESKYGMQGIYQSGTNYTIELENLKSGTSYSFVGQCFSQFSVSSEIITEVFQTTDNGGSLMRIQVDFETQPSTEQETKLLCFFSLYFQQHPKLVTTADGTYCTSVNYQIDPDSIRRTLQVNQDLDCAENSNTLLDLENVQYYSTYIYINKNYYLEVDDLATRINLATSKSCFVEYTQEHAKGIPKILQIRNSLTISETLPTVTSTPDVVNGLSWIHINNIFLSGQGKIFMIIQKKSEDEPTAIQVMNGLKYNNEKALKYSKQLLIDSEQEFKISFTNLSNSTKYVAYYVIGQDSPFSNVIIGELNVLDIETENLPDVSSLKLNIFLSFIILSVLILL